MNIKLKYNLIKILSEIDINDYQKYNSLKNITSLNTFMSESIF